MLVIAVNNAPPRLRGRLAVWLLELRAGVYIGNYSRRTREMIWGQVKSEIGDGDGIIAWAARTMQATISTRAGTIDAFPWTLDGLKLVQFLPLLGDDNVENQDAIPGS